jgi:hypothetical protein
MMDEVEMWLKFNTATGTQFAKQPMKPLSWVFVSKRGEPLKNLEFGRAVQLQYIIHTTVPTRLPLNTMTPRHFSHLH